MSDSRIIRLENHLTYEFNLCSQVGSNTPSVVGESLENFSLEGVQQQGETVKKAWVSNGTKFIVNAVPIVQPKWLPICEFFIQGNKGRRNQSGLGKTCVKSNVNKYYAFGSPSTKYLLNKEACQYPECPWTFTSLLEFAWASLEIRQASLKALQLSWVPWTFCSTMTVLIELPWPLIMLGARKGNTIHQRF